MAHWPARREPPARRGRVRIVQPERRLTASATTVSRGNSEGLRRLAQPWHIQALNCYDTVGECWYPTQFYARVLPKIRFYAGFRDGGGDIQEDEGGPLSDLWARVHDPGSDGRDELTGSYGRLMFLTGDGYLVVTEDADREEAWEYLSTLELRVDPDDGGPQRYRRIKAPGITPEELVEAPDSAFAPMGNEARVWRLYRRHPTYSAWSDSPVRAVVDLYELLKLLTLAAGSEATSRAATNGMFYWPDEMFQPSPDSEEGDENPMTDPLFQEIQEALMANIKDPGSAAAAGPINLRGPGLIQQGTGQPIAVKDLMGLIPLSTESKFLALDKMEKVIQRIENGLDGPDGLVTGTGDVNHWNGWLIDEQGYTQHVEPVASKFASDMVAAYLRPAARDAGIQNWERAAIGTDAAAAILHPDAQKTARDMWLDGVVGAEFYREAGGATEQDAPTEEERIFILALRGKGLPPELGGEGDPDAETAPQDGGTGADVEPGPPDSEPTPASNGRAAQTAAATFKIIGASELAVTRARAKAGARLVSRSKGCDSCKEAIRGVPSSAVASALGSEQVRRLVVTESELVAGAGDELAETIRAWGVGGEWTGELGRMVEQHAVRTLYETDPPPLPAGFAAVVTRALQAA